MVIAPSLAITPQGMATAKGCGQSILVTATLQEAHGQIGIGQAFVSINCFAGD